MQLLRSGWGHYRIATLATGLRHDLATSKQVADILGNGSLARRSGEWQALSDEFRSIWLAEEHEFDHHYLMAATPFGLLIWRMTQVLGRDIQWLDRKIRASEVFLPVSCPSEHFYSFETKESLSKQKIIDDAPPEYVLDVISNMENIDTLLSVFVGSDAKTKHSGMTRGELASRLSQAHEYMRQRCLASTLSPQPRWIAREPSKLVFPPSSLGNARDLVESHAVLHEAERLFAVGDIEAAKRRVTMARNPEHGPMIDFFVSRAENPQNPLGWSPFHARMAIKFSLCGAIDLGMAEDREEPLTLEDELPWTRIDGSRPLREVSGQTVISALKNLNKMAINPIIDESSNWIQYHRIDFEGGFPTDKDAERYISSLSSIGTDTQIYILKASAGNLLEFIGSIVQTGDQAKADAIYDKWRRAGISLHGLLEYSDHISTPLELVERVYSERHPITSMDDFTWIKSIVHFTLGQLIGGYFNGVSIDIWHGVDVPKIAPVSSKLANHFLSEFATESTYGQWLEAVSGFLSMIDGNTPFRESRF